MMMKRMSSTNRQQSLDTDYYHGDSMAPRKNRQNDRQAICFLYAASVVAASLSIAVASMKYSDVNEQPSMTAKLGQPLFESSLYATSCLILITMAGFFECHRSQTFEAVHRGKGPVPFSVKFSVKGEKVNLYLRLGLAMFGVMSIAHVAVKFAEDTQEKRDEFLLYLKSILEMAFFALQTLFILRYHRLVILRHNEVMGAGLVHLLTTNLCMWADTSVGKIDKTLSFGSHRKIPTKGNSTTTYPSLYNNNSKHEDTHSADEDLFGVSFYLLPTVSEYCLLAAALLYEIAVRIGQPSFIEIEKVKDGKSPKTRFHECRRCIRSAGSWFSILTVIVVVALTIGTVSTPNSHDMHRNYWKSITILAEEAILCAFGLGFVVTAIYQTRKLKFSIATRQSHVEEFLLYTAFFFSSNYTISTIILAMDLKEGETLRYTERLLIIVRCILKALELLQIVIQTYLIQDSFHRCSEKITHQIIKPGRQSIVALLGINLALWIQQSFQLKNADIIFLLSNGNESYGWILFVVTMPISLFYRYHCTVCLSQCFNKLYEDETQRFEEIWRYRVDPLTDMVIPAVDSLCMYDEPETNRPSLKNAKMSDASITSFRKKQRSAFLKNKPWKTFDIADECHTPSHLEQSRLENDEHRCSNHASLLEQTSSPNKTTDSSQSIVIHPLMDGKIVPTVKLNDNGDVVTDDVEDPSVEQSNQWTVSSLFNEMVVPEDLLRERGSNVTLHPTSRTDETKRRMVKENDGKSPAPRRQRLSMPTFGSPSADIFRQHSRKKDERPSKPSGCLKSPRHSFTKQNAAAQQVRRRRTLRNLETAKYRVLAAELAHRMVIERGSTAFMSDVQLRDNKPFTNVSNEGLFQLMSAELNPSIAFTVPQNLYKVRTNSKYLLDPRDKQDKNKSESQLSRALNESATGPISPVESPMLESVSSPKLLVPNDDYARRPSYGERIRRTLFLSPSPSRKNRTKATDSLSPTLEITNPSAFQKSGSWCFTKSAFRTVGQMTDKKVSELEEKSNEQIVKSTSKPGTVSLDSE